MITWYSCPACLQRSPPLVGREDTEGEDGVDQGNINVTDTNVLHVDGEVGQDSKDSSHIEEQGQLQRQQGLP